jgi:type VI secretion system protein ImpJ
MKKISMPIQWHEGMLLAPQHMQQNDLRYEQLSSLYFNFSSNLKFGLINLVLEEIYLIEGTVRVLEIQGIMPDGTIFSYNSKDFPNYPLSVDLKKSSDDEKKFTVNVCLAEKGEFSSINGDLPRFLPLDAEEVRDENLNDNVVMIPRLLPKIFLYVGEKIPERCVGMPIIKIDLSGEGFQVTKYIHPKFSIKKNEEILNSCIYLTQKLRKKLAYLSDRSKNQIGTPMLQETNNLMKPIISVLTDFEANFNTDEISPKDLHAILARSLGMISHIRLDQMPPVMPSYNHYDIYSSISPYIELINRYVDGIDESFASFLFHQKDRLFYIKIHDDYIKNSAKIFIGFRTPKGSTEYQMQEWVNDAVICSDQFAEGVTLKRTTGASRKMIQDEDVVDLMPSRGVLVYEVEVNKNFIVAGQNLNIFNPADTIEKRPTEIVLYIKKISQV